MPQTKKAPVRTRRSLTLDGASPTRFAGFAWQDADDFATVTIEGVALDETSKTIEVELMKHKETPASFDVQVTLGGRSPATAFLALTAGQVGALYRAFERALRAAEAEGWFPPVEG